MIYQVKNRYAANITTKKFRSALRALKYADKSGMGWGAYDADGNQIMYGSSDKDYAVYCETGRQVN